jgi:hypothetical protein
LPKNGLFFILHFEKFAEKCRRGGIPLKTAITGRKKSAKYIPIRALEQFNKSDSLDGKLVGASARFWTAAVLSLFKIAILACPTRTCTAPDQDAGAPFDCLGLFGGYGFLKLL